MSSMSEASVCREKDQKPRVASTISETANRDWFFFESDAK